jgi:enoyl-CoA hydratase/carnithine racemase
VIVLTRHGSVTVLRMAHGKANVLDFEFSEALTAQLDDCLQSEARALVLTGDGRMFFGRRRPAP